MARVELAPEGLDDFDRFLVHMARFEVENAPARIGEIVQAIQILTHSSLIGRPVKGGKRELVIGQVSHGYLALYRFVASIDTVFALAIQSQQESSLSAVVDHVVLCVGAPLIPRTGSSDASGSRRFMR